MQKFLHALAWLTKGLGILGALNTIPFLAPEKGALVFMAASLFKDFLIGLGDVLDDGKRNNSFVAQILAPILALTAGLGLSGCTGTAGLVRALSKDPATVSAKVVTPWGQSSLVRIGGSTNSVSVAPDGTVTINVPR